MKLSEQLDLELEALCNKEEYKDLSVTVIIIDKNEDNNPYICGSCCLACALEALLKLMRD